MPTQSFHMTQSHRKRVQAPPPRRPRVILSKEARAALTARRHENSHRFKLALNDAWNGLDETVKTIASSHHKSFRRVQNDLCLGRGMMRFKRSKLNTWNAFCWKKHQDDKENGATGKNVLQELVKDHHAEYQDLTPDEKAKLLLEYGEHKETQATGIRISTKSKVNDVTQTLMAVENELKKLRSRTGTEAILYATRGSTDLPLRGVAFTTEGVDEFMASVMNVDNQDLISKMEGFAVQGIKGAAKNHQKCCCDARSAIRHEISKGLVEITKDEDAKMHWANYFRNVIQRYQVIIEGWPTNIPFVSLSKVSSALPDLELLLRRWQSGAIHWRQVDDKEFQQLLKERNEKLENGEIIDNRRRTRSDKGKKRARSPDCSGLNRRKKAYKSAETVETDDEPEGEDSTEKAADNATSDAPTNPISPGAGATASGSGALTPYDEFTDVDDLLANLDRIFGPAPQEF